MTWRNEDAANDDDEVHMGTKIMMTKYKWWQRLCITTARSSHAISSCPVCAFTSLWENYMTMKEKQWVKYTNCRQIILLLSDYPFHSLHCKLQGQDRMSCPRYSHRSSLSFLPPFQEFFIPQSSRWIGIKTDLYKNCLIPRVSTSSWHPAWLLLKLQAILGIIVILCSFFLIHLMVDLDDGTAFFHWRYDCPNNTQMRKLMQMKWWWWTFVAVLLTRALLDGHVQERVHLCAPWDQSQQHQSCVRFTDTWSLAIDNRSKNKKGSKEKSPNDVGFRNEEFVYDFDKDERMI